MHVMSFLGIDPGKSGGLALVNTDGEAEAWKMPPTLRDLWDLMDRIRPWNPIVMLEHVHSMPRDGVRASFSFGQNYGALEALTIALKLRYETVAPHKWQQSLGLVKRRPKGQKPEPNVDKKNRHKAKAQALFPKVPRIIHATADALLIAEYARRKHQEGAVSHADS